MPLELYKNVNDNPRFNDFFIATQIITAVGLYPAIALAANQPKFWYVPAIDFLLYVISCWKRGPYN